MEKVKQHKSAINVLFVMFFSTTLFVLLIAGSLSIYLVNDIATSSIQKSIVSIQKMIIKDLSEDILMGGHNEVYRKCSNLIEDNNILSIDVYTDKKEEICSFSKNHTDEVILTQISNVYFDSEKKELAATINVQYTSTFKSSILKTTFELVIISILLILTSTLIISRRIGNKIYVNFEFLNKILSNYQPNSYLSIFSERPKSNIKEFNGLYEALYNLSSKLLEYEKRLIKTAKLEAANTLAKQVAHDIRSPLTALDMIILEIEALPEEQRSIIRNATRRIHDIANNLLSKNINKEQIDSLQDHMLYGLIAPIMAEKRIQYINRKELELEADFNNKNFGAFIRVSGNDFKRVLSNIINNSVDSITGPGLVNISSTIKDSFAIIKIIDNGPGISEKILPLLAKKGATFGKKNGSGLGLYHAKESVESWGGQLEIFSEAGKGTTVTLTIPLTKAPEWFLSKLGLRESEDIIILDDDSNIHQVWNKTFSSLNLKNHDINILHFSATDEFRLWFERRNIKRNYRYLFDFEIRGSNVSGLELIKELGIEKKATLVTSHYESLKIQETCRKNSISLLPKNLAPFVPTNIIQTNKIVSVLIDDDDLVRRIWQAKAKQKNIVLTTFASEKDFINNISSIAFETTIYIDSNLSDEVKGEDIAKLLWEKGFSEIYITTGYEKEKFASYTFLKGVIDKTPPW